MVVDCTTPRNALHGGGIAKFQGSLDDLKQALNGLGLSGDWRQTGQAHQFKTSDGACLNWWPSKGTINFQGPSPHRENLEAAVSRVLGMAPSPSSFNNPPTPAPASAPAVMAPAKPRRIFVVHGHDHGAREQLDLERPSDTDGIIYLYFNEHVKETVPRLTERLRGCGFDMDGSRIGRAAS